MVRAYAGLSGRLGDRVRRHGPWLVTCLVSALLVRDMFRVWQITNHHDLDVMMRAAQRLLVGEDIYADAAPFRASIEAGSFSLDDETVVWPYAYTPLIAILFVPGTFLPHALVRVLWWWVNVGAMLLGSWLSLRAVGSVTPGRLALVLLVLFRYEPAVATLRLGQIEMVQFALLATTLYALNSGRERWAGLALGLATGLKFFPGALIGLLLWRRRWSPALWALGVSMITVIGSFAPVGWEATSRYLDYSSMYGVGGAFAAFPFNQSFNGFFSRNLIRNAFSPTLKGWHLPELAIGLTLVGDVAVILVSAWLTRQRTASSAPNESHQRGQKRGIALEFSLAIMALLLVSPHAQVYTFVWALIPLIVSIMGLTERVEQVRPIGQWRWWAALIAAYLLVGRHYVLFRPGLTRFVQSHYLFGALLLWLALCVAVASQTALGQRVIRPCSAPP